jgi:hypothetical protein
VKQRWLLTTEETPSGEETVTAEASELQEKCTRQPVLTAKLKQKCLSSPTPKDRFTAGIVFLTTGHPEKTDIKPEFRFGTRKIIDFSFSCDVIATT